MGKKVKGSAARDLESTIKTAKIVTMLTDAASLMRGAAELLAEMRVVPKKKKGRKK